MKITVLVFIEIEKVYYSVTGERLPIAVIVEVTLAMTNTPLQYSKELDRATVQAFMARVAS